MIIKPFLQPTPHRSFFSSLFSLTSWEERVLFSVLNPFLVKAQNCFSCLNKCLLSVLPVYFHSFPLTSSQVTIAWPKWLLLKSLPLSEISMWSALSSFPLVLPRHLYTPRFFFMPYTDGIFLGQRPLFCFAFPHSFPMQSWHKTHLLNTSAQIQVKDMKDVYN